MNKGNVLNNSEYDKESISNYHILVRNLEEIYETCKK